MASGPFIFPNKAKLAFFAGAIAAASNTFKMTLHTSSFSPNDATNEVYADLANELSTGGGYTSGGITLSGASLTQTTGTVTFTFTAPVWTASGSGIPAWRYAYVRAVGTINGKVDPIVGHFLADTTPADEPATTAGNTLTVTPNASGVMGAA